LHGERIGGKCRLAKDTIAGGFGARIVAGYGADRHSVFLKGLPACFLASMAINRQETPMIVREYLEKGRNLAERIPYSVIALISRFAVADVFWRSGQTKVNGFSIREETFYLFREEYKVPLLPPDVAAYLSTIGEHVFPILLFFGLASRLSALGLFGMTMVIQFFVVPGGWPEHILWLSLLTLIIARGPGAVSLDHLIWNSRLSVPAIAHRAQA
jgi:putative oxidoreductase